MLGSEAIVYVKQPGNENRIIAKVDADTHLNRVTYSPGI